MIELLPLIYMTVFLIHVYMITASQIALQFFFLKQEIILITGIFRMALTLTAFIFTGTLQKKTPKTMRIIEESGTCTNVRIKFLCKLYFYYTLVSYTIKVLCAI